MFRPRRRRSRSDPFLGLLGALKEASKPLDDLLRQTVSSALKPDCAKTGHRWVRKKSPTYGEKGLLPESEWSTIARCSRCGRFADPKEIQERFGPFQ